LIVSIGLGVVGLQWWWLFNVGFWTPLPLRTVWLNAGLLLPHAQLAAVQSMIDFLFSAPFSACIIGIAFCFFLLGSMFEGRRNPMSF
jgi:hypothetical protein